MVPEMAMKMVRMRDSVQTEEDFINFAFALIKAYDAYGGMERYWDNTDVPAYLYGIAGGTRERERGFKNRGESMPEPSWNLFAHILLVASWYH